MKSHSKSKFSLEEDILLTRLVQQFGNQNWALIASKIKGRSTRQCRERYVNYLCPSVNRSPWTEQEDNLLIEKYNQIGPHWKAIADYFPNRTDINVKNRWLKIQRNLNKPEQEQIINNEIENINLQNTPEIPQNEPQTTAPVNNNIKYVGDIWVRFAEPLYKAVVSNDYFHITEDLIRYFK